VTVGFVTEAQWTAKRAFGVYHDDMEACRRRWKDEGVVKVYTVLPRALGFNVGPLSLKVVLADLESCVTFIQNDTNIHTVTLDCFQDIIDRKNTFASRHFLTCHTLISVFPYSIPPRPSIEISYSTAWLWLGNKQPIH
jgi:hypothetical protein